MKTEKQPGDTPNNTVNYGTVEFVVIMAGVCLLVVNLIIILNGVFIPIALIIAPPLLMLVGVVIEFISLYRLHSRLKRAKALLSYYERVILFERLVLAYLLEENKNKNQ